MVWKIALIKRGIGRYIADEWTDFVIHTRFTPDSAGFTKIWINGVLEVDYKGPTEAYLQGRPFPKFGLYMGSWSRRTQPPLDPDVLGRTAYHDDFKIAWGPGAGYDTVAPGGGSPEPNPDDPTPAKLPVMQNLRIERPLL